MVALLARPTVPGGIAMTARRTLLVLAVFLAFGLSASAQKGSPTPVPPAPPGQPATGPGGAEYAYDEVRFTHVETEAGGVGIFEPVVNPGSKPTAAFPLVLIINGCCSGPGTSGSDKGVEATAWIDHLARKGNVVLFPIYRSAEADADLDDAVRTALAELERGDHVPVDPDRFAAFGVSTGGVLVANFAATAAADGLPVPDVLMINQPGGTLTPLVDLSTIDPATLAIVLVADRDMEVGTITAREIWPQLTSIPLDQRDYVTVQSDDHGRPPLLADHFFSGQFGWPASPTLDALDWYGIWKPFDALMACAFQGKWCEYALGNTPEQRFMGCWSDGVPVNELLVTDEPEPPPRVVTSRRWYLPQR